LIKDFEDLHYSLESNKTFEPQNHLFALANGITNNSKTYPTHDIIDKKSKTKNFKKFIIQNYKTSQVFTGFEHISSSICC